MWEAIEAKVRKIRVAKTKRRGNKRRKSREKRGKGVEEKAKKGKTMEIKKIAEEWKIWDKEEEAAKLEEEMKKLVLEQFHK